MKRFVVLGCLLLVSAGSAEAQSETPKVDLFAGYSHFERVLDVFGDAGQGFGVNATYNLTSYFGLTADLGAQWVTRATLFDPSNTQQFLFGPRLTLRRKQANFFGHVLFGAARASVDAVEFPGIPIIPKTTNTDFAMGYGLGFDINLGKRFAIRPVQLDYITVFMNSTKETTHNLRYQAGIVFRFGGR